MARHTALPGFRDFHPEEMTRRQQIFEAWKSVARRWGFEEYDGPPLEPLELYIEKSGPEIVKQLFNFTDKGGREVAMRPEMTPTIVRMLGSRIKGLPRPVRWFSTPQLFRYEKQQRGRLREHFQLNMDIVGEASVGADADLLAAALEVMRTLGLTSDDVVARVSDRRLLQAILLASGVAEEQLPVAFNVIDKVERESHETLVSKLGEVGLSGEQAASVLETTGMSREDLRTRYGDSPAIVSALDEIDRYFEAIAALGYGDWVSFDMKIVRGLAYYTGIVFELFDRKGELRAICGGGRYDTLFASLADVDVPALGFGMGDVVLGELLADRGLAGGRKAGTEFSVVAVNDDVHVRALEIAARLRSSGRSVIYPYRAGGVGKAFKAADAAGVQRVIVVGPDELAAGVVKVKDLRAGTETSLALDELEDLA